MNHTMGSRASRYQDLSFEQLKVAYQAVGQPWQLQFASQLELLTEDGRYNYASYLLSDHNGLSIKVAKYAGTERINIIENNEYGYGCIVQATQAVLKKLTTENQVGNKPLLHQSSLKAAVINAIMHNDYQHEIPPKFELFSDRLEITSAGGIPQGLSKEDFFLGYSVPRNKEFIRIFKDLKMAEQLGMGLPIILSHYPKTIYQFTHHFMRLVLPYARHSDQVVGACDQALVDSDQGVTASRHELKAKPAERKTDSIRCKISKKNSDQASDQGETKTPKQEMKASPSHSGDKLGHHPEVGSDQDHPLKSDQGKADSDQDITLVTYCSVPRSVPEMMQYLGMKHRTYFRRNMLQPLVTAGQLVATIPDKPTSPKQRFVVPKKTVDDA